MKNFMVSIGITLFFVQLNLEAAPLKNSDLGWFIENGAKTEKGLSIWAFREIKRGGKLWLVIENQKSKEAAKKREQLLSSDLSDSFNAEVSQLVLYGSRGKSEKRGKGDRAGNANCKSWITVANHFGRKSFCDSDIFKNEALQRLSEHMTSLVNNWH